MRAWVSGRRPCVCWWPFGSWQLIREKRCRRPDDEEAEVLDMTFTRRSEDDENDCPSPVDAAAGAERAAAFAAWASEQPAPIRAAIEPALPAVAVLELPAPTQHKRLPSAPKKSQTPPRKGAWRGW